MWGHPTHGDFHQFVFYKRTDQFAGRPAKVRFSMPAHALDRYAKGEFMESPPAAWSTGRDHRTGMWENFMGNLWIIYG